MYRVDQFLAYISGFYIGNEKLSGYLKHLSPYGFMMIIFLALRLNLTW